MNPDPVWSSVNWVHLTNADPLSLQRLGVRYRLHPLVIEDLVYHEDRTKMDKYKTHYLVTVPFLRYRKHDDDTYRQALLQTRDNSAISSDDLFLDNARTS